MQCEAHRDVEAFWECSRCGKWHCEACIRRVVAGAGSIAACAHCDGTLRKGAAIVLAPRDEARDLLRRPISADGLLTAGVIALPAAIGSFMLWPLSNFFFAIYLAVLSGYYFQTVDHIGRGHEGLPFSADFVFDRSSAMQALGRGLVCFLAGYGPYLLWTLASGRADTHPVILLGFLALGIVFVPAAILSIVLTNHTLAGLWPLTWTQVIGRAPREYARLVGLFALSTTALVIVNIALLWVVAPIPLIGTFMVAFANSVLAIAQAAVVGGFLRRHAELLGYD